MERGWGRGKKPPDLLGRLLFSIPGVLFPIRHDPDQANHKRSLLRKKEDDNQANDNFDNLHKVHFNFLSKKQKTARLGGLCFFSRCVRLLGFHLGHPNRKLVLKNKDRNNNDKDEAGEKSLHSLSQVSPDYRTFRK